MGGEPGEKGLVCVTGAGGFVASWLVKKLLEHGYRVRGTVRDPSNSKKTEYLWGLPRAKERLELVAADLLAEGSFDAAFAGCEGVFHTAAPVIEIVNDAKAEMIDPCVNGSLNVLRSCAKTASVKKIVYTSSSSTVRFRPDYGDKPLLDETSWTDIEFANKYKIWYPVAKTESEKASWEFANAHNLNMVSVIPSYIVGPVIPTELNGTSKDIVEFLTGEGKKFQSYGRLGYLHIDDAAEAHIFVYESPAASGRYIVSSGEKELDEVTKFLANRYPELSHMRTDFGRTGMPYYNFDTSKLKKLGFPGYKSFEEMWDDTVNCFRERGLL